MMAVDIYSVPAMSSEPERVFSGAKSAELAKSYKMKRGMYTLEPFLRRSNADYKLLAAHSLPFNSSYSAAG